MLFEQKQTEESKLGQIKQNHLNTMPKVIEKEAAVEDDEGSLPSDHAINKT